jgi:thiamine biosynthesis lipoprotein
MKLVCLILAALAFIVPGGPVVRADDLLTEIQSRSLLGATMRVQVCYVDGRQDDVRTVMDRIWIRLGELNARTDRSNEKSDIGLINGSSGAPVTVHEDVFRLLERSRELGLLTKGYFDITAAPLTDLWAGALKQGQEPAPEDILRVKGSIGMDKVGLLLKNQVLLRSPDVKIDVNEVIRAFGVDEAVRILKEARMHNFLVDGGGDIYAAGKGCDGLPWRFGIKDPEDRSRRADAFTLSDSAVSISSDRETYGSLKGPHPPRIINILTGYPQPGVASAAVIAPTAMAAHVFSLTLSVIGPSQGVQLITALGAGYDALAVLRREEGRYEWFSTPGYERRRLGDAR